MFDEHSTFAKLIESLKQAEDAAKLLGVHRSDRRWDKVAENFERMRNVCYDIATQGMRQ